MKKDPFQLVSPNSPQYQQPQIPQTGARGGYFESGQNYQQATAIPVDPIGVEEGDDSEFRIAMNNLATAKSRYLSCKPPLAPSAATKPSLSRNTGPQPLPPIPHNITLRKAPIQQPRVEREPVAPAPPSQNLRVAQVPDPIDSTFSQRPTSVAFSPLELAKLPDFNFDDDDGENAPERKFRLSQFYPEATKVEEREQEPLMQESYEREESPLANAPGDQPVKVTMLPPMRPAAVSARRQQQTQVGYGVGHRTSQLNHSNNLLESSTYNPARHGGVYDVRPEEKSAAPPNTSNQSLIGSYCSSAGSQAHIYGAGQRNQTEQRFIPVAGISSFKGLVKRPSRFIGQLDKLGRNKRWQRRIFTIDHSYLVCFKEGKVSRTKAVASREPGTPAEVTNHLVWDDAAIQKTWNESRIIKWILPLDQLDGIYLWKRRDLEPDDEESRGGVLDKLAKKLKRLLFNPCSATRLIDSASMVKTDVDTGESYEWIDVLEKFRVQRKVSMDEMKRNVSQADKCYILLTTSTGHFHLLHTRTEYELFNWCMLLAAKRILIGN